MNAQLGSAGVAAGVRSAGVVGFSCLSSTLGVSLGLFAGAIGMASAPSAHASSFLETFGLGVAGGTVLGASTLPFYERPNAHSVNLAIGAAIGAAVGLGAYWFGRRNAAQWEIDAQEQQRSWSEPRVRWTSRETLGRPEKAFRGDPIRFGSSGVPSPEPVRPVSLIAAWSP